MGWVFLCSQVSRGFVLQLGWRGWGCRYQLGGTWGRRLPQRARLHLRDTEPLGKVKS